MCGRKRAADEPSRQEQGIAPYRSPKPPSSPGYSGCGPRLGANEAKILWHVIEFTPEKADCRGHIGKQSEIDSKVWTIGLSPNLGSRNGHVLAKPAGLGNVSGCGGPRFCRTEQLSERAITAVYGYLSGARKQSTGMTISGATQRADRARNQLWRRCAVCSLLAMTFNCALGGLLHVQLVEHHHHQHPWLRRSALDRPSRMLDRVALAQVISGRCVNKRANKGKERQRKGLFWGKKSFLVRT